MELTTSRIGPWKVLTPKVERLDASVAEDFKAMLLSALADGTRNLVVHLGNVRFMDSSGLGSLVYVRQRMEAGGRLCLAEPQLEVATILRLTHLDKVFLVCEKVSSLREAEDAHGVPSTSNAAEVRA